MGNKIEKTVTLLKYGNTNTYLVRGRGGFLLFDTDWAGTLQKYCQALGELGVAAQDVKYLMISHFHPDHMGIAQEIAELGTQIIVADVQKEFIHRSDAVFAKDKKCSFVPIDDSRVRMISIPESRAFLQEMGIFGEILHTPGHTEDSISLWLDEGALLVGDLNPLYELELHINTQISDTWEMLLSRDPRVVYYGHAKPANVADLPHQGGSVPRREAEQHDLVQKIIKYINKGYSVDKIAAKTGADSRFVEDVNRMYLTHQNISVQGILDRIEIKGR